MALFKGTREEAIRAAVGTADVTWTVAAAHIDSCIALGLWTPEEPKSLREQALDVAAENGWAVGTAHTLLCDLEKAGFTITKAEPK